MTANIQLNISFPFVFRYLKFDRRLAPHILETRSLSVWHWSIASLITLFANCTTSSLNITNHLESYSTIFRWWLSTGSRLYRPYDLCCWNAYFIIWLHSFVTTLPLISLRLVSLLDDSTLCSTTRLFAHLSAFICTSSLSARFSALSRRKSVKWFVGTSTVTLEAHYQVYSCSASSSGASR